MVRKSTERPGAKLISRIKSPPTSLRVARGREPGVEDDAVVGDRVAKLGDREHQVRHKVGILALETPAPRHAFERVKGELLEEPGEMPQSDHFEERPERNGCPKMRIPAHFGH